MRRQGGNRTPRKSILLQFNGKFSCDKKDISKWYLRTF